MKLSHIALIMVILPATAFAETNETTQNKTDNVKGYVGLNIHNLRAQLNDAFGEEFSYTSGYDTDTDELINPDYSGISLNIGAQINEHFGIEGFLQKTSTSTANMNFYDAYSFQIGKYKSKTSALAFGVDFIGYIPITDTKFSLMGSLGLGYYKFDGKFDAANYVTDDTISASDDENNIALRIGLGGQYEFSERWALRGMVRYVAINYDEDEDIVKDLIDISLGVKYTF